MPPSSRPNSNLSKEPETRRQKFSLCFLLKSCWLFAWISLLLRRLKQQIPQKQQRTSHLTKQLFSLSEPAYYDFALRSNEGM
jgi:hypothetical protein